MKVVRDIHHDPIGVEIEFDGSDCVTLTTQYISGPERAFFLRPAEARALARNLKKAARKVEKNAAKGE